MARTIKVTGERSSGGGGSDAGILTLGALGAEALATVRGIITELLRAAAINPYMAVTVSVIIADILHTNKIISDTANDFVIATGATVTAESIISDILNGGILKPSANTIVYGADQASMTSALLSGIKTGSATNSIVTDLETAAAALV